MKVRSSSWRWLTLVVLCSHAAIALARPGGGHTFSAPHSSSPHFGPSGGGDGGGGGELIMLLLRLMFFFPKLSLVLLLGVVWLWWRAQRSAPEHWESSPRAGVDFARLLALDPDFSRIVFEDFCFRLYASAQRARHDPRALAALAPYLNAAVTTALAAEAVHGAVTHVVVGALKCEAMTFSTAAASGEAWTELSVEYVTNLTLGAAADARTFYQRELWVMGRAGSARTKPPEQTERLGCPNCGAPFQSSDGRRCSYCDQVVADGRFAWQVVRRTLRAREPQPPALTRSVDEAGTNLPSVLDPNLEAAWAALCARDPNVSASGFSARVALIYGTLNTAWSALDLAGARGLCSDGMFDYLRYWTEAYTAQGLRNVLEDMHIQRTTRVKVVLDRHFDAITLRIWASGLDATIDAASGALVSGSRSRPRDYSEYWTLIRSAQASGPASGAATCPSCAAPLAVSMAGTCTHCGSHVTRGEFDWVLSKIEQDDVYTG